MLNPICSEERTKVAYYISFTHHTNTQKYYSVSSHTYNKIDLKWWPREGRREQGFHNEELERHPPNHIFHRKNARVRDQTHSPPIFFSHIFAPKFLVPLAKTSGLFTFLFFCSVDMLKINDLGEHVLWMMVLALLRLSKNKNWKLFCIVVYIHV